MFDSRGVDDAQELSAGCKYPILSGSNPMTRAHVASIATGSDPIATNPRGRGRPIIGPSPSIAITASTTAKCGRIVAVDPGSNWECHARATDSSANRTRLRGRAKQVLHAARHAGPVMRLSFGIEMTKSDSSNVTGSASSRRPVNQLCSGTQRHHRDRGRRTCIRSSRSSSLNPGRRQKVFDVAPVARPLADDHLGRARSPARDRRARNH